MVLNQTTKYGLFFVGGLVVGALGAVAIAKGKKFGGVKPLASSLLSAGIDVKDKVADVVAEAQVKSQERREAKEVKEAAEVAVEEVKEEKKPAAKKTVRRTRKAKKAEPAVEAVAA